jgi:hypothetical protein
MIIMTDIWDADPRPLTEEDRRKILSRLHSLLFWLGKLIPEEDLLEGERIPLREVIFRFVMNEKPSPEEVQGAMALADVLEAKARFLEKDLREKQLTKGQAHIILDEICGLLRAVDDIRKAKVGSVPIMAKTIMNRVQDERRWLSFVKKIT